MNELTNITHLIAESFGEPGDRTFRISAKTDSHIIYIWVEKEHLIQLSLLVFQLSEKVSSKPENAIEKPSEDTELNLTIIEFRVGKIALEFDPETELFTIEAIQDDEPNIVSPIHIRSKITPEIIIRFAKNALEVCAAGRPTCNLCLTPIDKNNPHKCPKLNGHLRFEIP
ncbi:MAG: hypothetical protein CL768_05375 [Chloroflexi bacterium]|nr:hypothetical protein [Chloroflexota bacterium]